jgi:hypothetical protein
MKHCDQKLDEICNLIRYVPCQSDADTGVIAASLPPIRKNSDNYKDYLSTQAGFVDIEAFRMHD